MKYILSLAFFTFLWNYTLQAQWNSLNSSSTFDEPETGYAKLLFLKNNNTVYVHATEADGIEVRMYDAERKPLFIKTITTKFGKLKKMTVKNLFEVQGNLALFFTEQDGDEQRICRVIIDGKDGHILQQDELADMGKVSMGKKYAIAMGSVDVPDFFVRNNAEGNSYAVAVYNSFASESGRRIEVILYNGKHQEVYRSFVSTPQNNYKYVNMLDMALSNEDQVQVWIYGFNTQNSMGGEAFIATLDGTAKTTSYKTFYQDIGRKSTDGILRYDASNKRFIGVTQAIASTKNKAFSNKQEVYYEIRRFTFDPATGQSVEQPVTGIEQLDEQTKALYGSKKNFQGVLQNFYVNANGTQTLIFEGLLQKTTYYGSRTSTQVYMENAGVVTYDKDGHVVSTTVVPFSHQINNNMLMGGMGESYKPLEHYNRTSGGIKLKGGNQFKSFFFMNGKDKNYILLNDIFANEERLEKKKDVVTIQGLEEADAFVFDDSQRTPTRQYLFGAPAEKKKHNLALLTLSDYNRNDNIFVTLRIDADGKKKTSRLVWLQPK